MRRCVGSAGSDSFDIRALVANAGCGLRAWPGPAQSCGVPTAPRSVLIVSRTFPPDPAAVGQLVAELARELAARGWRVGVATTSPAGGRDESIPGVEVSRVPGSFTFTRESTRKRALSYLGIYPALLRAAGRLPGRWDLVVTTSDPPLQVLLGPLLRATKGGRLIQWSQDLYPELAEELEVLARGGPAARVLRRLSTWGLEQCDLVVVPGRCMADRMRERGLPAERIRVVPNWSDPSRVQPIDRASNPFRRHHGLADDAFVVMYSGNFGLAHSFDEMLDAADRLRTDRPEIVFLLVGDGPRLEDVRAEAARRGLSNLRFLPLQPRERLAESLSAADLHLVTMPDRLSGLVVPSKFYGVLAAGRPCVFVGPPASEVALVVGESGVGVVTAAGDADALTNAIVEFASDSARWVKAGAIARTLSAEYSVAASADKFLAAWGIEPRVPGEPD